MKQKVHHSRLPLILAALGAVLVVLGTLAPDQISAHKGAVGVVKHRMDMMKSLQASMKELLQMFRKRRPYDAKRVVVLARAIAGHADHMPKMFPKGSNAPPSEALNEIWSDPKGFDAATRQMRAAALALENSAAGLRQDALKAFAGVARSCTGCHTRYRKRK